VLAAGQRANGSDLFSCDAINTTIVPRGRDIESFEVRRRLPHRSDELPACPE